MITRGMNRKAVETVLSEKGDDPMGLTLEWLSGVFGTTSCRYPKANLVVYYNENDIVIGVCAISSAD